MNHGLERGWVPPCHSNWAISMVRWAWRLRKVLENKGILPYSLVLPNRSLSSGPGPLFWKSLTCCCPSLILSTQNTKKSGKGGRITKFEQKGPFHSMGWLMDAWSVKTRLWEHPKGTSLLEILTELQETDPFQSRGAHLMNSLNTQQNGLQLS